MFIGNTGPFVEYNQVDKITHGFSPTNRIKNIISDKFQSPQTPQTSITITDSAVIILTLFQFLERKVDKFNLKLSLNRLKYSKINKN